MSTFAKDLDVCQYALSFFSFCIVCAIQCVAGFDVLLALLWPLSLVLQSAFGPTCITLVAQHFA
jgi:hypothetical protein